MTTAASAIKVNFVREHNTKLIMEQLYRHPYSCLELSQIIGISDVGVRKIIKQIEELHMVRVNTALGHEKKKGNPHIRYEVDPDCGLLPVIDFTHYKDEYVIYDFAGKELCRKHMALSDDIVTADVLRAVALQIKADADALPVKNKRILSVAVSAPGQVDEERRNFTISHRFRDFQNEPTGLFYRILEDVFGAPIVVNNNVAFMALGEAEKGNRSACGVSLYMFVGYGVSSSILYNDEVLCGWRGYAGEIGGNHFGNDGTYSLNSSIVRLIEKVGDRLETKDFAGLLAAYREDPVVTEAVRNSANVIGYTASNIINLIGADLVVIGGESLQFGDEFKEAVKAKINRHSITPVTVRFSTNAEAAFEGALKKCKESAIEYLIKA